MLRAKTHIFWNPQAVNKMADKVASERMQAAATVLAEKTRSNLQAIIQHAISRPAYKRGKDAGKWWTARDAGELLRSVRIVQNVKAGVHNIWVMVGQKKAYYATMFEYATRPGRGQKFFRPAIAASKAKMKSIIERGQ